MPPGFDEEIDALLPTLDPAARIVVLMLLRKALAEMAAQNAELKEQIASLRRMLFGHHSERLPLIASEVRRVVEEDELTLEGAPMPEDPKERTHEKRRTGRKNSEKKRKKKRQLRRGLPVIHERVEVAPDQLPEGYTLEDFRAVGEGEKVRRVEHVSEHLVVVEYNLQTLASRDGEHIVKAETPNQVVPGGQYGASVYAQIIVNKCADSLPLFRIARRYQRAGLDIARSTLCSLFHRGANLLEPIYERMFELLRLAPLLHADETRMKMQDQPHCKTAWVWTLLTSAMVCFRFSETRGSETADDMLAGSKGTLMVDGYVGYNGSVGEEHRIRAGCWAHTRRKFFEARSSAPEASEFTDLILEIYRVEYAVALDGNLGNFSHARRRATDSKKIVDEFNRKVFDQIDKHGPKTNMGKALTYAKNQRVALEHFLTDPAVPLDNNLAERELRIIATGRKNFLFVGHADAGQNLAILQSIVATCRLQNVNPVAYLEDVLIRVQTHPASRIDELLPANWKPPDRGKSPQDQAMVVC